MLFQNLVAIVPSSDKFIQNSFPQQLTPYVYLYSTNFVLDFFNDYIFRISKDFKIKSYFPETKHIFVQFLSKYINSLADAILFEAILSMALDLYDFSCNLFSFRSLFPLIYGSLFLSKFFRISCFTCGALFSCFYIL